MTTQFSIDLRCARRKAGLTQADCGHLIGRNRSCIKRLEAGDRRPTLEEILQLSLLFGRSFEAFFEEMMAEARMALSRHLKSLPAPRAVHAQTFNRKTTLDALAERLAAESQKDGPR